MNYLAPVKAYADCVASVDSRRLYRLGLFEQSPNRLVVECQVVSAETPRLHVEIAWDADAGEVRISAPSREDLPVQAVAINRNPGARGGGFYFRCPVAGESCEKLYYVEGSWGGRKAKRLTYSSQNGSLRDRYSHTARRLVGLLEGRGGRAPLSPDSRANIEARLAKIEQKLAAAPRRAGAADADTPARYADLRPLREAADLPVTFGRMVACDKAVERAQALGDDDDALGWLFRRSEKLQAMVGAVSPQVAVDIAHQLPDFPENYPRISLKTLGYLSLVKPGSRRGVRLDWSGLGCEIDSCNLMVDLREDEPWFAGLEIVGAGQTFDQALRVVATATGDLRFICPISGAEVDTVAYRAGCFASAAALRMTRRHGRP